MVSLHLSSLLFSVLVSLSGSLSLRGITGGPQQLPASIVPAQNTRQKEGSSFSVVSSRVKGWSVVGCVWSRALAVAVGIVSPPCTGWGESAGPQLCPNHVDRVAGGGGAGLEPPGKMQVRSPEDGRMGV